MQKKNFRVGKTSDFPDPILTNGQSKLRSWVLLSSVRVAKKVSTQQKHQTYTGTFSPVVQFLVLAGNRFWFYISYYLCTWGTIP
jgi:hypothetical protein